MAKLSETIKQKPWVGWVLYAGTILVVFLIGLIGSTIIERRSETVVLQTVKPIAEWEPRNSIWGENYPREYETYIKTEDTSFSSKYLGSINRDALKDNPDLVIMWAGYAFSRDYNQARGHYNAIKDIRATLRTDVPQPSTCWTCKSTDVPRMMKQLGVAEFYKKPWKEMGPEITNAIGCQDCHDPKTMDLRIARPDLVEAHESQGNDLTSA